MRYGVSDKGGAVKVLLAALALTVMGGEVLAVGVRWDQSRIPVFSHMNAEWQPLVKQQVALFNAMLPDRAPRLVYRAEPERLCPAIKGKRHKRGITICPIDGDPVWFAVTMPTYDWRTFGFKRVRVQIAQERMALYDDVTRSQTVCHELMHAITGVRDDYDYPHLATSCVQGALDEPGSWDRAFARRVYRKHGRR